MKLLVLHVAGLPNALAKRPDLAENISNIMEMGAYVPVFPEFPALEAPALACVMTGLRAQEHGVLSNSDPLPRPVEGALSYMRLSLTTQFGPKDPATWAEFRKIDATIGSLEKEARAQGIETVIVSGAPMTQVAAEIELKFPNQIVDHQVAYVSGDAAEIARAAKSIDKGIQVLASREDKAVYHVDHPKAGVVLIAPPGKSFSAGKGSMGRLPLQIDDYGVFVASVPFPAIQRRPFINLTEVAGLLKK